MKWLCNPCCLGELRNKKNGCWGHIHYRLSASCTSAFGAQNNPLHLFICAPTRKRKNHMYSILMTIFPQGIEDPLDRHNGADTAAHLITCWRWSARRVHSKLQFLDCCPCNEVSCPAMPCLLHMYANCMSCLLCMYVCKLPSHGAGQSWRRWCFLNLGASQPCHLREKENGCATHAVSET